MTNTQLLDDLDFVSALLDRDMSACTAALDAGADPDGDIDRDGRIMLIRAVEKGFEDAVRLLLDRGANVDGTASRLEVPLVAAAQKDVHILRLLLERGANVHLQTLSGTTALSAAVQWQSEDAVAVLIGYGADPNARDSTGKTPLHFAAASRKPTAVAITRRLVEAGANSSLAAPPDLKVLYLTPFQNSVYWGCEAVTQYFLDEVGEDPMQTTSTGQSMLELASKSRMKHIILSALTARSVTIDIEASASPTIASPRKGEADPL